MSVQFNKVACAILIICLTGFAADSQNNDVGIKLKLQLIDSDTWGVFATTITEIDSSTITGSGQVTAVMPNGFQWSSLNSVHGLWHNDANVYGPAENPYVQYISFGLVLAGPNYPILYKKGMETLLFTFKGVDACPDFMYLIDCGTPNQSDPFCPNIGNPNSHNSNPGNDLSVIEFNTFPIYYNFEDIYAPQAWDCHDNDNDGILNAIEDTNGNGVYDPGIDASDLNVPNFTPGPGPTKKAWVNWSVAVDSLIANPNPNISGESIETDNLFTINKNGLSFSLSPNPAREVLHIIFGKEFPLLGSSLYLMDLQGHVLQKMNVGKTASLQIDVAFLLSGLYIVVLEADGLFTEREKFVKY